MNILNGGRKDPDNKKLVEKLTQRRYFDVLYLSYLQVGYVSDIFNVHHQTLTNKLLLLDEHYS
jgi:hypothetical protein